ncbi:MAG: hypothetical protein H6672_16490 [Anaerolineaceae bacterium]|nr:hypothetical protein [Anaerolineaceae bacterium]
MTQNVVDLDSQWAWILAGALVLLIFAVTTAWPHRSRVLPGSKGHRPKEAESGHETIRPDGFIDSFANDIEEAGGGLPLVVKVALPGIILWWLVYLVLYWSQ